MKELSNVELLFAEFLRELHRGKENAITAKRLKHFGSGLRIRELVHALRIAGVPICSGRKGYYYASTAEELNQTLRFLKGFVDNISKAYDGLKDTYYEMKTVEIVEEKRESVQRRLF